MLETKLEVYPAFTRAARRPAAQRHTVAVANTVTGRGVAALVLAWALLPGSPALSQTRTDRQVYEAACAACHGIDGRGAPAVTAAYPIVPADFTDCNFAVREPNSDWLAVSHDGGPARAFDRLMPALGEALGMAELEQALAHVRTFCADRSWPRGELNLPRALVTEKAFPEDEAVLTVSIEDSFVGNEFLYERRFGARNQVEVVLPLDFAERGSGDWTGGFGDLALAFKRVVAHSLEHGRILSVVGEVVVPTGSTERGIGGGTAVVEPFVAFGQILAGGAFVQAQAGAGIPLGSGANNELFWRGLIGKTFTQGRFGRAWSPMVELLGAREFATGEEVLWDIVPQMQVTLSTRQHIMLNAGARVPLNERDARNTRAMVYLLWDWFDGGFLEGW